VKTQRTIKIKLESCKNADNYLPIWLKCLNWVSGIAFKTKELNSNRLQKQHYAAVREMGLPSQLACSVFKRVCATYKTAKANKHWKLAIFKKPVFDLVHRRNFAKTSKGLTILGQPVEIFDSRQLPDSGWQDSKLKRIGKDWYLILSYEIEIPEPKEKGCIVGVDMGVKRMLVASNSANAKPFFYQGGELNHRRSCIRRTRAAVQSVGTKSSRRLLKRMSGNEAAVTGHLLHVASKALVKYAVEVNARKIVVEDLSNIRDASLKKGKDLRSKIHRWPYADMIHKIKYKAAAVGIDTEIVSARNTSRACNACGHVSASNRNGLHFHCKKCGHKDDADLNASKNIRARSVSIACNAREMGSPKSPEICDPSISLLECSVARHSGCEGGLG
jgi:IS605 OrfB family transposase